VKNRRWQQTVWGEYVAEAFGTFVLLAFGLGSVAMTVAALSGSGRGTKAFDASGDWLLICIGWGIAVTLAVYVAGGVTGAHINPAVTLSRAMRRGFPWSKVPGYMAAQVLGAFAGAALVLWLYHDAISALEAKEGIERGSADGAATFGIFATTPAPYFTSPWGPFLDQVVGTAFLVGCIFSLQDERNAPVKANLAPVVVGLVVTAIGISFGANAGFAINPARDLGPRLLAGLAGWGGNAIPGDYGDVDFYMWVPIVGPLVGGAIGAYLYDLLIRDNLRARGVEPDPEMVEAGSDAIEEHR